jgi:arylsulfatase
MVRLLAFLFLFPTAGMAQQKSVPPNVVLIFADDLGYTDLGCYGAKGWKTPNLDRLAKEGVRFTDFHVSQAVCSASRTSLLTGCYANRLGIHGALGPGSKHGIAETETTLGELFKSKGYATCIVGKWHLGHLPQFLPTRHGFDRYLGLPYSNDMWPFHPTAKKGAYPPLPLIENDRIRDEEVTPEDQAKLTTQYTEFAVKFIEENKTKPFFLYVPHSFPHVPLFVSDRQKGKSEQGLYGDVIQEIDSSVGELLKTLEKHGLDKNTLVIFTSDNGPWLGYGNHAGTRGNLREGKGTVFEGGIRVPCVARWPGQIPAGSVQSEMLMTIDLFPTLAHLIGAELPKLKIDGQNAWPLFRSEKGAKSPQTAYWHYYAVNELRAIRSGKWKLILPHSSQQMLEDRTPGKDGRPAGYQTVKIEKNLLYDLESDVSEKIDLSEKYPQEVERLLKYAEEAREELGDALTKRTGKGNREPDRVK